MRRTIELAIVFMIGVLFVLALVINVKHYENSQNKTQNYSNDKLYYESEN